MVVGEHQQLVMVGVHLVPPYTAAGEDWLVRMWVPYGSDPGVVEFGENTLAQGWSTG